MLCVEFKILLCFPSSFETHKELLNMISCCVRLSLPNCMCAPTFVCGDQKPMPGVLLGCSPSCFWDRVSHWVRSLLTQQGWPASPRVPGPMIASAHHSTWLIFQWVLGIKLWSLYLQSCDLGLSCPSSKLCFCAVTVSPSLWSVTIVFLLPSQITFQTWPWRHVVFVLFH